MEQELEKVEAVAAHAEGPVGGQAARPPADLLDLSSELQLIISLARGYVDAYRVVVTAHGPEIQCVPVGVARQAQAAIEVVEQRLREPRR